MFEGSRVWLITGIFTAEALVMPVKLASADLHSLPTSSSSGFGFRLVIFASLCPCSWRSRYRHRSIPWINLKTLCLAVNRENLRTVQLDVTEGEEAIKDKVNKAAAIWGGIDVLVNNAGWCKLTLIHYRILIFFFK